MVALPKPRLIMFDSLAVSDHNRSALNTDVERIETVKRMANGIMRKYVVADKRTFSTSWTMLPNNKIFTVDGYAGADDIETFYNQHPGAFELKLYMGDGTQKNYSVMFTNFSKTLIKRGKFDFYDVDITMEEV